MKRIVLSQEPLSVASPNEAHSELKVHVWVLASGLRAMRKPKMKAVRSQEISLMQELVRVLYPTKVDFLL